MVLPPAIKDNYYYKLTVLLLFNIIFCLLALTVLNFFVMTVYIIVNFTDDSDGE